MLLDDPDLNEISDFSKNTHENTGLFGILTSLFRTFLRMIDFALQIEKQRKHASGRQRERKEEVL